MGYERHNTIVVTGIEISQKTDQLDIITAHAKAASIFPEEQVSPLLASVTNGCRSFFIAPDGSKEGWSESDDGDKLRDEYISLLRNNTICVDWVEVQFGDGDNETIIIRHSDE